MSSLQKRTFRIAITIVCIASTCGVVFAQTPYQLAWSKEIAWEDNGTLFQRDSARHVLAGTDGGIFVVGATGEHYGEPAYDEAGGRIAKYDASGTLQWVDALYSGAGLEHCMGATMDDGNVYIAGETYRYQGAEAFLIKYAPNGTQLWERHVGSPDNEFGRGVTVDPSGNVYLSGSTTGYVGGIDQPGTYDLFLTKYDTNGNHAWTKQMGDSVGESGNYLTCDSSGDLYMAGHTLGNDHFLAKLDTDGNIEWRIIPDIAPPGGMIHIHQVEPDANGDLYMTGTTYAVAGDFTSQATRFLAKLSPNGDVLWAREYDSTESYGAPHIGEDGYIYLAGNSDDHADTRAASWVKYDTDGNLLWTQGIDLDPELYDSATDITVDAQGRVYIIGNTAREANGYYNGDLDIYLARFDPVPEPATMSLLGLGAIAILRRKR
jgi:hypothetical protein